MAVDGAAAGADLADGRPTLSPFRLGCPTTLANPRSAASVAGILAITMPVDPPLGLSIAVTMLMVVLSASRYAAVAWPFAMRRPAEGYRRLRRWIDLVDGAGLVILGVRLATDR